MSLRTASQAKLSSVRNQLAANSASGLLRFLVASCIYLFLYPFMLRHLQAESFGLWALLGIASQYAAIGDLGISNAVIKKVAEVPLDVQRDFIGKIVGSSTVVYALFGTTAAAVVFIFHRQILLGLHIRPALMPDATVLLLGMVLILILTLLANVYISVLSGLHRMDLANFIQVGGLVVNGIGSFVAIELETGLPGLVLCNALSVLVVWTASVLVTRRVLTWPWSLIPAWDPRVMARLLSFGSYLYVAGLAALLLDPAMKILLARYGKLEWVSEFELASRVVTQIRSLFLNVMLPLLPAASLLSTDLGSIRLLLAKSMRLLWLVAVPLVLLVSGLAKPITIIWLSKSMPHVEWGLTLLSLAWLFNVLTLPAYLVVQGLGKPRLAMWCSLLQGAVSLIGSFWLIPRVGFYGAISSESAAFIIAAIYMFVSFMLLCPMSFGEIFGESWPRALLPPLGFAAMMFLFGRTLHISAWTSLALGFATLLAYAFLMYRESTHGLVGLFTRNWISESLREKES